MADHGLHSGGDCRPHRGWPAAIPLAPRIARAVGPVVGERCEAPVFLASDRGRLDWHGAAGSWAAAPGVAYTVAPEGAGTRLLIEHDGLTGIPAAFGLPSP